MSDQTLEAGKAWLLERLDRGSHPLDGLDRQEARRTVEGLSGLGPEPWTTAWGARFSAACSSTSG